jgi:hypothetical protein
MDDDRKKPGVAFWATVVVVVVLVLYPLSIGPAYFFAFRIFSLPKVNEYRATRAVELAYLPVWWAAGATHSVKPVSAYIHWWIDD